MERITAKQNQLIKDTKKLMTSSKARRDRREFVLEGVRLCSDVLHSFYKISVLLITPQCIEHNYDIFSKLSERAGRTVDYSGNRGKTFRYSLASGYLLRLQYSKP